MYQQASGCTIVHASSPCPHLVELLEIYARYVTRHPLSSCLLIAQHFWQLRRACSIAVAMPGCPWQPCGHCQTDASLTVSVEQVLLAAQEHQQVRRRKDSSAGWWRFCAWPGRLRRASRRARPPCSPRPAAHRGSHEKPKRSSGV